MSENDQDYMNYITLGRTPLVDILIISLDGKMPNARIDVQNMVGGVGLGTVTSKDKFMMRQRSLNHPGRETRIRILDIHLLHHGSWKTPFFMTQMD